MKKNNILLMVTVIMCSMFIGINKVVAKEATCKYSTGDIDITIKYNSDGTISIPKTVDEYHMGNRDENARCDNFSGNQDTAACQQVKKVDETYTVKSDMKAADFLVNGYIQVCPGTNNIDYVIKGKKIYISWSEDRLRKWLTSIGVSANNNQYKKATLTSSNIKNGKTGGKKCTYTGSSNSATLTLVYWLKDKTPYSFSLSEKSTSGNSKSLILHSVHGKWTSDECPKRVSVTKTTDKTDFFNEGDKFKVYRGHDDGKITMELKENDDDLQNNDDDSSADGIDPDDFVEGCGMWGSLLGIIKEIFNTVKWLCAGGLVLLTMFDFTKAVSTGNDDGIKKAFKKFVSRVIILVIIFILPTLIDFIFSLFSGTDGINVESCISEF